MESSFLYRSPVNTCYVVVSIVMIPLYLPVCILLWMNWFYVYRIGVGMTGKFVQCSRVRKKKYSKNNTIMDFRLINSPHLIDCLQYLKLRRSVAFITIFHRYSERYFASRFANCMSLPLPRSRCSFPSPIFIHRLQ